MVMSNCLSKKRRVKVLLPIKEEKQEQEKVKVEAKQEQEEDQDRYSRFLASRPPYVRNRLQNVIVQGDQVPFFISSSPRLELEQEQEFEQPQQQQQQRQQVQLQTRVQQQERPPELQHIPLSFKRRCRRVG